MSSKFYEIQGSDIDRRVFPGGRVKLAYRTDSKREQEKRKAALEDLRTWGAWDVFRAIADRKMHIAIICHRVKRDGEKALPDLRRELEALAAGAIPTVGEETERYLRWYGAHRKPRSLRQVKSRLKRFSEQERADGALLSAVRMDELVKADIENAINAISKNGSTRESIRLAVSGLFTWSNEDEAETARKAKRAARWAINPAKKVERGERTVRVVTAAPGEVLKLLAAAEIYQEAYLRVFVQFGLRLNELIHTRLHDDLDVRDWVWRIQGRGADNRCGCPDCQDEGWSPKSKQSWRTLHVPPGHPIRGAIEKYLRLHPAGPGDYVFRNPRTGNLWDSGRLEVDFKRVCERAGTRTFTPHALRHTCATELIRVGVRESVVAAQLGDTVDTIVKTYIHLKAEDLAAGVAQAPRYEVAA